MSVFRVNIGRDKAAVAKALPKTTEADKSFPKCYGDMVDLQLELASAVGPLKKKLLAQSRQVYTKSDKALKILNKDKKGNKDEIAQVVQIRKQAYGLGMMLKDLDF